MIGWEARVRLSVRTGGFRAMSEPYRDGIAIPVTRRRALMIVGLGLPALLAACAPPGAPTSPAATAALPPSTPSPSTGPASPATTTTAPPADTPTVAPTSVPATPSPTAAPRSLTWWTGRADSAWLDAARAATQPLSASHPELTINVDGGYQDFGKIVGGFAEGHPPDAFDLVDLVPFADRSVLRPLDAYLSGSSLDPHNYLDAMWANGTWRDKPYGIPALDHGPMLGLFWNASLTGAGLPDSARASLASLEGAGKAMTKQDSTGVIQFLGLDPLDGVGGLLDTARDLLGQDWVDLSSRSVRLNSPPYIGFLNGILAYYNSMGIDHLNDFRGNNPTLTAGKDSAFNQGKEGVLLTGYWSVGDVARFAQNPSWTFQSGWAPASPTVQRVGGRLLTIPVASKQPDGGWELLQQLASDDASALFLDKSGTFAATRSFIKSDRWRQHPGLSFWIDSITSAGRVTSPSRNVVSGYAEAKWEQAVADALAGNRSPQDALNAAQSAVQAELTRFEV